MKKQHLYSTAVINTDELTDMPRNDIVRILRYHERSNTYDVQSSTISNYYTATHELLIHAYVPGSYLTGFVL